MESSHFEQPSWRSQEAAATDAGSALKWLLVGIGIGAGVALLLAPTSGPELRGKIGRGFGQTWNGISRGTENLRQRGSNLLNFRGWRSGQKLQEG
jgi:YtxH-like protein